MAYAFLVAPTPSPEPNSRYLGLYLYTALEDAGNPFTVTHSLNLTPPYFVTISPQGAHDVPTLDPNPSDGVQTADTCQVETSAPLTPGDKYLLTFYTVPA